MIPPVNDGCFSPGHVKPYKLRAKHMRTDVGTDARGFPNTMEYELEIDGEIVQLDLEIDHRMTSPTSALTDRNGKVKRLKRPNEVGLVLGENILVTQIT